MNLVGIDVDDSVGYHTTGKFRHEGRSPIQGPRHDTDIRPPLEAMGGLGMKPQTLAAPPDG